MAQSWHGKFGPGKTKALQVGRLLHCDAAPRLSMGAMQLCHHHDRRVAKNRKLGFRGHVRSTKFDVDWERSFALVVSSFVKHSLLFTDILAGFTFNNRALRLPAIVFNKTIAGRPRTLLLHSLLSLILITGNICLPVVLYSFERLL